MRCAIRTTALAALLFLSTAACPPGVPDECPFISCPAGQECVDGVCTDLPHPCEDAGCHPDATCAIEFGVPVCTCDAGFVGDGLECEDVDECAEGLDDCGPRSECVNTPGSFECVCGPAYVGDGETCDAAWRHLVAGSGHFCAIRADGTLWCWGFSNEQGQLGTGDTAPRLTPTRVGGADDWLTVDTDVDTNCALRADGTIWCWGLGSGDTPQAVAGTDWTAVAMSGSIGCGLRESGRLYCWQDADDVVAVGSDEDWTEITGGSSQICGLRSGGSLWCFSHATGDYYEVGSPPWEAVAAGGESLCGIRSGGALHCGGPNDQGQAGLGHTDPVGAPLPVADGGATWSRPGGMSGWTTCGIQTDGSAWCWGSNSFGSTGSGTPGDDVLAPARVRGGLGRWTRLEPLRSDGLTCGLRDGGRLYCWGSNAGGLLYGEPSSRTAPVPVVGEGEYEQVVGLTWGTCARTASSVDCWGAVNEDFSDVPVTFTSEAWEQMDAGPGVLCGIRDESLFCMGDNDHGQLGQGHKDPVTGLVEVGTAHRWHAISMGWRHACGLRTDGALMCWGSNQSGQVAAGDAVTEVLTPSQVGSATDWEAVSAGGTHSCGIRSGELFCWGDGRFAGQGEGAPNVPSPAPVTGGSDWDAVAAGHTHTCAIQATGELWCWGFNYFGQLGLGHDQSQGSPDWVGDGWRSVDPGWGPHTCGVRANGTLWTWGSNESGQLGIGEAPDAVDRALSPVQVGTRDDWRACSTGAFHACGLGQDGRVECFGLGMTGQLGHGQAWSFDPIPTWAEIE